MSRDAISLLSLVDAVDLFPYSEDPLYWKLKSHDGNLLGYITPEIALRFTAPELKKLFIINHESQIVQLSQELLDFDKRTEIFKEISLDWKKTDELLSKTWRNEQYVIYNPQSVPYMLMERSFAYLLGVPTHGAHVNGYIPPDKTKEKILKMWIPRRSLTKSTYPGMLDNTIAGGLAYPYGIWENVVKECYEEGGLDKTFVEQNTKLAGVLTWICQPYGPRSHAQPEVSYIYDLQFESETDHVPHPVDGEAEYFELMTVDEVRKHMLASEFKPPCALVVIDFLMRHGYIGPEDEPDYTEILSRIHRRLPFATRR